MPKATSVLSTPPLNTPIDHSRRNFFSTAAGLVAAGTALAAAVNVTTLAAAEPDPIFAVIERHRDLSAHCSAAYAISGNLHAGPEFDAAEAVSTERHDLVIDQANALICAEPTTMAGVLAMMRYAAAWPDWQQPTDDWTLDDASADSHQVLLQTLAGAIESIIDREGAVA
jgi:hypothetical protein